MGNKSRFPERGDEMEARKTDIAMGIALSDVERVGEE